MSAFERWAVSQGCVLVALAIPASGGLLSRTGYEESAVYFRKVLDGQGDE
jgi:hypothetical protein